MTPSASTHPYKHHRFPGEMLSYAVWLYVRLCLSYDPRGGKSRMSVGL